MAQSLSIYRGVTYPMVYNHTDSAGVPQPLTGCTIYFTVKQDKYDDSLNDSSALIQKTITSHPDAANGVSGWTLNDSDTQLEPGKYYFDVIVEDSNGHAQPPSLIGTFTVLSKTTNRNVGNEA